MSAQHGRLLGLLYSAVLVTAGCGTTSVPLGIPSTNVAPGSEHGASWVLPQAKRQDLLYVSYGDTVNVYAYRKLTLVGTLTGFQTPEGECVDSAGNVFITDSTADDITEYRHGGAKPVVRLSDPQSAPFGCSIDSSNGDLCVANFRSASISVYAHASGKPRVYSTDGIVPGAATCAYDGHGDMFVAGPNYDISGISQFGYLPKGNKTFVSVSPLPSSSWTWINVWSVQWDGKYWEIGDDGAFRFTIEKDGQATYEGATNLPGIFSEAQAWIVSFHGKKAMLGSQIVAANEEASGEVNVWTYPGGQTIGSMTNGLDEPFGVAVSLAGK